MSRFGTQSHPSERLVRLVQALEHLAQVKADAAERLTEAFEAAQTKGFDTTTLKVVLKLRKLSPGQRQERRALEAIYMAALGMLEGEALPEAARRRLDGQATKPAPAPAPTPPADGKSAAAEPRPSDPPAPSRIEPQPPLPLKTADEARAEGAEAATAGKRIYDNPYPAGDPCRAAWDEGWCAARKSHGMEPPAAYQRRTEPAPPKEEKTDGAGKKGAA